MSLLGNTEYIKTKSGDYIEIHRGMFHTHVILPDGSEIEMDTDFDELVKILELKKKKKKKLFSFQKIY